MSSGQTARVDPELLDKELEGLLGTPVPEGGGLLEQLGEGSGSSPRSPDGLRAGRTLLSRGNEEPTGVFPANGQVGQVDPELLDQELEDLLNMPSPEGADRTCDSGGANQVCQGPVSPAQATARGSAETADTADEAAGNDLDEVRMDSEISEIRLEGREPDGSADP